MKNVVEFLGTVEQIWRLYQAQGAGNLPLSLAETLDRHFKVLQLGNENLAEQELQAAKTAYELAKRCVERTEGLNFVTGEAGLIPRRDLIERFEKAINVLREGRDQ